MILEFHDGFTQPRRVHVTRCLLTDDGGHPILAAVDNGDGSFIVTHVGEGQAEFQKGLQQLGVAKTVTVDELDLKKLKLV